MQELKVIGVESGALVAASDDGDRFRIAIDDVLQSTLRQRTPESGASRKISPREIQSHIRSGMSAEDVASLTGASIEYIQRFEGPILAEREYIVTSALSVPVHIAADLDPLEGSLAFGSVIRDRLAALNSTGERWTSWKEEDGDWIIKLSFTLEDIDHDGRWSFDPKKQLLLPLNVEATTLSQHSEAPSALIPKLRAVGSDNWAVDESRFDSGAFSFSRDQFSDTGAHAVVDPGAHGRNHADPARVNSQAGPDAAANAAINRAAEKPQANTSQTADLLDALRRRRGERETGSHEDLVQETVRPFRPGPPRLVDIPLDAVDDVPARTEHPAARALPHQQARSSKKGRASMPSWDEIVFGARSDDDPA